MPALFGEFAVLWLVVGAWAAAGCRLSIALPMSNRSAKHGFNFSKIHCYGKQPLLEVGIIFVHLQHCCISAIQQCCIGVYRKLQQYCILLHRIKSCCCTVVHRHVGVLLYMCGMFVWCVVCMRVFVFVLAAVLGSCRLPSGWTSGV